VLLHPVAFAGWLGLFVTALNLLPMGQLDGGHILHALSAPLQRRMGRLGLLVLLPLGFLWAGWWVWGFVILALSRRRIAHPPVLQEGVPLGPVRTRLAWLAILVFFLTFVPIPIQI
jgi:membrane-associated protease RseP (regulator of RpoE activity)